jgi:translocation and assembly module TamB
MARIGRILAWTVAAVVGVPLLLVAVILVGGNTGLGRYLIERLSPALTGGEIRLAGLAGRFPDRLRAAHFELRDKDGAYLTIDGLTFDWSPLRLLHATLFIDRLDATEADFVRMPVSSGSSSSSGLPVRIALQQMQIDRLQIGAAVAGQTVLLSATGSGALDSTTDAHGSLTVHRLDGAGQYSLDGSITAQNLQATIKAAEPAHGLISGLAGLPDLGPVAIDATLDGPWKAVATSLAASAGKLRAQARATLDLEHDAADLTVSASAPAMMPRPDISWQDVSVDAHIRGPFTRPELSGQVRIDALQAVGTGVGRLTADLNGNAGTATLHAVVAGLTLPGQDPSLFAAAPVVLNATARLDAPDRPVSFTLQHPLIQAQGTAQTAGALAAHVSLTLPNLTPVAAAGGADVQGNTALTLDVARQGATTSVALRGTIGVTGGLPQAKALLGDAAKLDLAASLTGRDAHLTRLHVTGRGVDVSADGSLVDDRTDLHWTVAIDDLSALDQTLTGQLDASGQVSGPENDLAASADLHGAIGARGVQSGPVTVHIAAQGLPSQPSGTVTAQGAFLNAPIDLALAVSRTDGAIHVAVQKAAWKSLQAAGALTVPPGGTIPQGTLHIRMAQLADLSPLLGRKLAGSIDAALESNAAAAHLTLTAQGAGLPGTAAISRAALDATVTNPQSNPTVQATLALDGISAGSFGGAAKITVRGPQNALAVTLSATSPDLSGAAAQVAASASVDLPARRVSVSSLQADWRQQTVRLLAPAILELANGGATIGNLRLGLRQAVLAVNGRVSPTLDLTASLRNLPADIAAVASPSLALDGTIAADARLTGSLAKPTGTVRLTATRLRDRSGPGQALPAANVTAEATLDGADARLDVRATAGASRLTLTGTAPLVATGALDLRAGGALDLAMLNPILSAQGRRVQGQVALDATIGGTPAAPRMSGTARLTGGEAQDYPTGVRIGAITATVRAEGDHVDLTQFSGRAGDGTIGGSGSIGLAAPMPVNLTFTADNARPIASDLLTATIDSHLTVHGDLDGSLTAAGTLHVRRAQIQVPDKMPASVAVLQVRNAPTSGSAPGKRRPPARVAARAPARHVAGPVRAAAGTPPAALAGAPAAADGPAGLTTPASAVAAPGSAVAVPGSAVAAPGSPAIAPAQAAPERTIALDITLDAPQEVLVRGRGLDVELGGTIHISGTASRPDSSGSLNLKRGTLSVVGQTLTFTDGDIDFTGAPLTDPNLKLVATSTTNNIIATVTVSGSASDPKITLSSVPELPQDEILAQLLFHQGVGSLSAFQVAEIAAGLAELSGVTSGVGDPLASLRNALGLDRLTVGSGSTGNATLEAGRYIAPGVYLGAQQSATGSGTQASVQIDIAKGLKVVTTAGTGSSSATGAASSGDAASVGLTYQFEY